MLCGPVLGSWPSLEFSGKTERVQLTCNQPNDCYASLFFSPVGDVWCKRLMTASVKWRKDVLLFGNSSDDSNNCNIDYNDHFYDWGSLSSGPCKLLNSFFFSLKKKNLFKGRVHKWESAESLIHSVKDYKYNGDFVYVFSHVSLEYIQYKRSQEGKNWEGQRCKPQWWLC